MVIDLDQADLNGLVQGKFNRNLGYLTPPENLAGEPANLAVAVFLVESARIKIEISYVSAVLADPQL